jgi:small neutral amino acid transporter SnatA (MarC family)
MLQGNHSSIHHPNEEEMQKCREAELSVAVSPLAMPILAGPGTLTTAMNFSARGGLIEMVVTIAVFAVLCVITYVLFVFGEKFVTFIGAVIHDMNLRLGISSKKRYNRVRGGFPPPLPSRDRNTARATSR